MRSDNSVCVPIWRRRLALLTRLATRPALRPDAVAVEGRGAPKLNPIQCHPPLSPFLSSSFSSSPSPVPLLLILLVHLSVSWQWLSCPAAPLLLCLGVLAATATRTGAGAEPSARARKHGEEWASEYVLPSHSLPCVFVFCSLARSFLPWVRARRGGTARGARSQLIGRGHRADRFREGQGRSSQQTGRLTRERRESERGEEQAKGHLQTWVQVSRWGDRRVCRCCDGAG